MMTLELELPDTLARQLEELVRAGLFLNPQEAVRQAVQEFLRQHSATLAESQQLADVAWALREAPAQMTVVCDTGPVLHLLEADALELLSGAGTVFVPPAVNRELEQLTPTGLPEDLCGDDAGAECAAIAQAVGWRSAGLLHEGEAQALALALVVEADWFLTDDAAARVFADSLGLETHGSLGVVLWCAGQGQLDQSSATTKLEALVQSSLWISLRVQTEARRALAQMYR